ncbi:transcriptional activator hacA [Nannizzia gypsea CBS 118893]|uniref:Transcriptional activator hacA n=1 Tax=Arthroderma gypseum (strain ATCC MYA-4604 / CBS 118893) TaxID=535722 RepID=E4V5X8_ARTGP|nr:transcriptional activator hacA [Nannizzia gypsea CBS 118893]EFR05503.1 transcriptional activator hacA [Nannizzia gypsea CBS 118893]
MTESTFAVEAFSMDSMSPSPGAEIPGLTVSPADTTLKFEDVVPEGLPKVDTPKPAEKKPVKKRKSWGQELPTPKTNLPPRKRAKTEDEKEQRRIERVLRNRAAAQISRERKRLEIEKLEGEKLKIEQQNEFLLRRLSQMEAENNRLNQQVAKLASEIQTSKSNPGSPASVSVGTSSISATLAASTSPTLAPVLFKQENDLLDKLDGIPFTTDSTTTTITASATNHITSTTSTTLSPADLDHSSASPSDLTQHPAAVLCDLQCQSEARPWMTSTSATSTYLSFMNMIMFTLPLYQTLTSAAYSTLIQPASLIFLSLKTGSPLNFSPAQISALLPLILWLISAPTTTTNNTSSRNSTTRSVFRSRLLSRLLACSPALARPLRDATSRELQLVLSESAMLGSSRSGQSTVQLESRQRWESLVTILFAIDRAGKTGAAASSSSLSSSFRGRNSGRSLRDRPRKVIGVNKQSPTKRGSFSSRSRSRRSGCMEY